MLSNTQGARRWRSCVRSWASSAAAMSSPVRKRGSRGRRSRQGSSGQFDVELRTEGTSVMLSPALDLVAYRIVQEALTNAIKHGPPGRSDGLRHERGRVGHLRYGPRD